MVTELMTSFNFVQVAAIEVKCKGMDVQITEDQIMNVKECLSSAGVAGMKDLTPETAGVSCSCY